jgi:hypothetical protein
VGTARPRKTGDAEFDATWSLLCNPTHGVVATALRDGDSALRLQKLQPAARRDRRMAEGCDRVIEAPWLVNGGHGASLTHHNERTQQRTSRTLSAVGVSAPPPFSPQRGSDSPSMRGRGVTGSWARATAGACSRCSGPSADRNGAWARTTARGEPDKEAGGGG